MQPEGGVPDSSDRAVVGDVASPETDAGSCALRDGTCAGAAAGWTCCTVIGGVFDRDARCVTTRKATLGCVPRPIRLGDGCSASAFPACYVRDVDGGIELFWTGGDFGQGLAFADGVSGCDGALEGEVINGWQDNGVCSSSSKDAAAE